MARILWVLVANLMWAALAGPASDPLPLPPSEPVRAAANQPADLIPRGYLPLVSGRAPSVNRVVNGDFEQGAVGWQQSSAYPGDLILDLVALALRPHSGQWAAWLGGENKQWRLAALAGRDAGRRTGDPHLLI